MNRDDKKLFGRLAILFLAVAMLGAGIFGDSTRA